MHDSQGQHKKCVHGLKLERIRYIKVFRFCTVTSQQASCRFRPDAGVPGVSLSEVNPLLVCGAPCLHPKIAWISFSTLKLNLDGTGSSVTSLQEGHVFDAEPVLGVMSCSSFAVIP